MQDKKKKFNEFLFFLFFVTFSFAWMFLLTYNFNFFWEDGHALAVYKDYKHNPEQYTPKSLAKLFVTTLFYPFKNSEINKKTCACCLVYKLNYMCRPLHDAMYSILIGSLGINIIQYRITKAALFSLLMLIYLYFLWQPLKDFWEKNKKQKNILSKNILVVVLITAYLAVLPEFFIATLYYVDELFSTMFFATLALFLFYFFYNKDCGKIKTILLFLGITIFTHISILIKHVARINFLLIFSFLLLTDKKKLIQPKYFLLILMLLFLSVPFLGFLELFSGESIYTIMGISGHLGGETETFELLLNFIKTFHLSFIPHAKFLLIFLLFMAGLHIYALLKKINHQHASINTTPIKNIVIWSGIWFLLEAVSLFISRGFNMERMFFLRMEFSIFIFSQILFVSSYAYFVYNKHFIGKKIIYYTIILILLLSISHNVLRLNEWRGGWGAYFLKYDAARTYVDEHEKNAVLLVKESHALPTYFVSNNTIKMIPDILNVSVIESFAKNYSTILVAHTVPIDFMSERMQNTINLTIIDKSPYGMFKKIIGRYYESKIYIYTFIN